MFYSLTHTDTSVSARDTAFICIATTKGRGSWERGKKSREERKEEKKEIPLLLPSLSAHFSGSFFFKVMTPTQFGMKGGEGGVVVVEGQNDRKRRKSERRGVAERWKWQKERVRKRGGGGVSEEKKRRRREGVSWAECGVNGRSARLTPY